MPNSEVYESKILCNVSVQWRGGLHNSRKVTCYIFKNTSGSQTHGVKLTHQVKWNFPTDSDIHPMQCCTVCSDYFKKMD